jgi:hypothetical protein
MRAPDRTEFVWTSNGCHGRPARPDCWGVPGMHQSLSPAVRARLLREAPAPARVTWSPNGCRGSAARPECAAPSGR